MIEEEAFVSEIDGDRVWIEKTPKSACSGCSQTCPSSVASQFFGAKTIRFPIVSSLDLKPGDRVLVGVPENALLGGAFRMYLAPLLMLFAGALAGQALAQASGALTAELGGAVGGLLGLLSCLIVLKASRFSDHAGLRPVILHKIN